jgi:hypothetical protein
VWRCVLSDWIKDVREGDLVIATGSMFDVVAQVERLTKTQVITKAGGRYRRDSGRAVGADTWSKNCILQATADRVNSVKASKFRRVIRTIANSQEIEAIGIDDLRKVYAILIKERADQ